MFAGAAKFNSIETKRLFHRLERKKKTNKKINTDFHSFLVGREMSLRSPRANQPRRWARCARCCLHTHTHTAIHTQNKQHTRAYLCDGRARICKIIYITSSSCDISQQENNIIPSISNNHTHRWTTPHRHTNNIFRCTNFAPASQPARDFTMEEMNRS